MNESVRNLSVGLFVVIAFTALGLLMVWFGEAPRWLGQAEWMLRIRDVRELRGLAEGAPVYMNGVEVGRVGALDFENPARPDYGPVIVARIRNQFSVPKKCFARVYGATLGLGTGRIELVLIGLPGGEVMNSRTPPEEAQIQGEMRSMFAEIIRQDFLNSLQRTIDQIGDLTERWTPVGENLARLLENRPVAEVSAPGAAEMGHTANISTVVERIDQFVAHLNTVLGDTNVQDDVKSIIRDLQSSARSLKDTVALWQTETQRLSDNLNAGIDKTEEDLDRSFRNVNSVLEKLDTAATSLARVLREAEEGRGTIGRLARDDRLYESAVLALDRLGEALGTLNRILGKIEDDGYITVGQAPSGVLRKNFPVPGAESRNP